jgi:hypothetical protein
VSNRWWKGPAHDGHFANSFCIFSDVLGVDDELLHQSDQFVNFLWLSDCFVLFDFFLDHHLFFVFWLPGVVLFKFQPIIFNE